MCEVSVLVPARNEASTIAKVVQRIFEVFPRDAEVIVIDDGSTDGTADVVRSLFGRLVNPESRLKVIRRLQNGGKGSAIRDGLAAARGTYVIFQDADLELEPGFLPALLRPLRAGPCVGCYGSRFLGGTTAVSPLRALANVALTRLTNAMFGTRLTDMETGQKAFRRSAIAHLPLRARGYEIEPEITALIARAGHCISEVPVTYRPKGAHRGQIGLRAGVEAIWTLVYYRLAARPPR